MVTLLKNYEQQTYILNAGDDIDNIVFRNGDMAFLMDQDVLIIYDEGADNWYPVPTGGDTGGDTVYYSGYNGVPYVENMVINGGTAPVPQFSYCDHLKSIDYTATGTESFSVDAMCANNPLLETAIFRRSLKCVNNFSVSEFRSDTALKVVQLGDLGKPCDKINSVIFRNCTQSGLTITIYTTATSLATLPSTISNSPWGATNATIVFRNSTTGEVLT